VPAPRTEAVAADGLRWCVQSAGPAGRDSPTLLLLHGTGASVHSFAALLPLLADAFTLTAIDLPGHGATGPARAEQLTMPGMGRAVAALLQVLQLQPRFVLGHSAGAALGVRMVLDGWLAPQALFAVNGAFLPFGGPLAPLLSPLARLLYSQRWVPQLFARRAADAAVVRRLIEGTGSRLDDAGVAAYQRLMRQPGHAQAALGMMAHWDLAQLAHDLPRLSTPLHLLVGARDRAVPPAQAQRVAALCQHVDVTLLEGAGHLAHEEAPAAVARWLQSQTIPGGPVMHAQV
jgi:magnesium chelatase accessory protein